MDQQNSKMMWKMILVGLCLSVSFCSEAQFSKARLQATGLTCALCSNAINKALQKLPFIEQVNADIKHSAFDISFKKDQPVELERIRKAVEDAGFFVGGLQVTGQFSNLKIGEEEKIRLGANELRFLQTARQTLNGEQTFRVLNKEYVTAKEFKKLDAASRTKMEQIEKEAKSKILFVRM